MVPYLRAHHLITVAKIQNNFQFIIIKIDHHNTFAMFCVEALVESAV